MTTYADNLKTIVGIKQVQQELQAQIDKLALAGQRGIGYDAGQGAVAGAGGLTPQDLLSGLDPQTIANISQGATDAAIAALAGAATGSDNSSVTGGTDTTGPLGTNVTTGTTYAAQDGTVDALKLLNGSIGVGSNVVAKIISGLTDPKTGKQLAVNMDGLFRPPSDRPSDNVDGVPIGYFTGQHWPDGKGGFDSSAGASCADQYANIWGSGNREVPVGSGNYYGFVSGPTNIIDSLGVPNGTTPPYQYTYTIQQLMSGNIVLVPPGANTNINIGSTACTVGSDSSCPASAPTIYNWPVQTVTQVVKNGSFQASLRDSTAPLGYVAPSNTITAITSNGTYATLKPTKTNGFLIGASDANGNFISNVRVFNSNNQAVAVTTATGAAAYLP